MNRDQFEGNWKELKGFVKEKWGKFTDDDLTQIAGKYDQFVGKLMQKYGYAKEKAEEEIRHWKYEHRKHERDEHKRRKAG